MDNVHLRDNSPTCCPSLCAFMSQSLCFRLGLAFLSPLTKPSTLNTQHRHGSTLKSSWLFWTKKQKQNKTDKKYTIISYGISPCSVNSFFQGVLAKDPLCVRCHWENTVKSKVTVSLLRVKTDTKANCGLRASRQRKQIRPERIIASHPDYLYILSHTSEYHPSHSVSISHLSTIFLLLNYFCFIFGFLPKCLAHS